MSVSVGGKRRFDVLKMRSAGEGCVTDAGVTEVEQRSAHGTPTFSSAYCVGTRTTLTQGARTHTKLCCHGSDMPDHNSTLTSRMEKVEKYQKVRKHLNSFS